MELNKATQDLVNAIETEPLATVIVESDNNDVAQALGRVIGHAIQNVGFNNVTVKHHENLAEASDDKGTDQTDWEQGKSMLEAMADANPSLFHGRIEVVSACLGEPEDEDEADLPPNEAADLEVAIDLDRDD